MLPYIMMSEYSILPNSILASSHSFLLASLKASNATLAELRADLEAVKNHHTSKVAEYSAADKLGQVNARNKTANTVVDGVDRYVRSMACSGYASVVYIPGFF